MVISIDGSAKISRIIFEVIVDESSWREIENKPGFDWYIEARRYLHAAEVLRESAEYQWVNTPTLHLLAHGSELLLKANLIASGCAVEVAKTFCHNIWELWQDDRSASLRAEILKGVDEEWAAAKMNPAWQDTFDEEGAVLFEEYLKRLSALHTKETGFALRYVRSEGTRVPKPHFLGPVMYRVADRRVRAMTQANQ
ncbi:MAG: hypothetical protein P1U62_04095 [Alteraurantiacibacter sp. bin_em_oilr2.035]|uniref:hypothetical protein n=1 Tax=Aurantiacibacter atlanticus TaxID=1648404 RepID=UPI00065F60AF|nr:hypothetical protein [Aurantiacibacter atlanticus]MDF1834052.1 hypothetical protein [Alteraurantiacibacter sp. bin_em_oilr2.035]